MCVYVYIVLCICVCMCVCVYVCVFMYVCMYVCVFRENVEPNPRFAQNVETACYAIGGHSDARC